MFKQNQKTYRKNKKTKKYKDFGGNANFIANLLFFIFVIFVCFSIGLLVFASKYWFSLSFFGFCFKMLVFLKVFDVLLHNSSYTVWGLLPVALSLSLSLVFWTPGKHCLGSLALSPSLPLSLSLLDLLTLTA